MMRSPIVIGMVMMIVRVSKRQRMSHGFHLMLRASKFVMQRPWMLTVFKTMMLWLVATLTVTMIWIFADGYNDLDI